MVDTNLQEDIIKIESSYENIFVKEEPKEIELTKEEYEIMAKKIKEDIDYQHTIADTKEFLKEDNSLKAKIQKLKDMHLPIDNYYDNARKFYCLVPYFYDHAGIFWFWNEAESKYEQFDDIDVMNLYDEILGYQGQTVNPRIKNNTLEAMKRYGRKKVPKNAPCKWIQFKDKAYSIESGNVYQVEPNYFFTNPIPWELGETDETPTMDKLFTEWVGKEYVTTLYELMAYCCYTEYPIQLLFCLYGSGRNGKGCFLKVLDKFIGKHNVTSTALDLIAGNNKSRFESFKLYKKLVCLMGETNFGMLDNTSLLKQLVGGDKIGYEKKGKDPFDEYNYAKILIASNSLPTSQDTSDGFYRRWLIITFAAEFPEGKDITKTIPEIEYHNLARKVVNILPKLLDTGCFTNQGTIQERRQKYIFVSNPIPIFIELCCEKSSNGFILSNELYIAYIYYLHIYKKRKVKTKEFKGALEDEGFWAERTSKKVFADGEEQWKTGYWVEGLTLKADWKAIIHASRADLYDFPHSHARIYGDMEKQYKSAQTAQSFVENAEKTAVFEEKVEDLVKEPDYKQIIDEAGENGYPEDVFIQKYGKATLDRLYSSGEAYRFKNGYIKTLP